MLGDMNNMEEAKIKKSKRRFHGGVACLLPTAILITWFIFVAPFLFVKKQRQDTIADCGSGSTRTNEPKDGYYLCCEGNADTTTFDNPFCYVDYSAADKSCVVSSFCGCQASTVGPLCIKT
jgi:hypothetical protein